MITQAQVEVLLKLAEALDACEQQGIQVNDGSQGLSFEFYGVPWHRELNERITGMSVRLAINELVQK